MAAELSETVELKTVDSMPGSLNELISTNKRLKRPPSLSESFAWTPENIERAYRTALLSEQDRESLSPSAIRQESPRNVIITTPVTIDAFRINQPTITNNGNLQVVPNEQQYSQHCKYEKTIVSITIKLLFHITLISIFETIFFFLYVSTLENNGIETTVNTFINGAANGCKNLTQIQIQIINDLLTPFINATQVINAGNNESVVRAAYNTTILNQAWAYVGGLSGLFLLLFGYVRARKIEIKWKAIILENLAMVLLLALYEFMFFETIIYPYQPITASEIERNAIQKLQTTCGILE